MTKEKAVILGGGQGQLKPQVLISTGAEGPPGLLSRATAFPATCCTVRGLLLAGVGLEDHVLSVDIAYLYFNYEI